MNQNTAFGPDEPPALSPLDANEARVVGCLIEKQATTPDVYPLTLNAVVVACNQKTSRDPILDLEPGEVGHALRQLEGRGLVGVSLAARSSRYEHRFDRYYEVTPRQRALLGMLLLRGAQTINELYQRCERLCDFPEPDEVRVQLERLAQRAMPLVVCLGRGAGQREDRYMHLLGGPVSASDHLASSAASDRSSSGSTGLSARVEALESEVAELRVLLQILQSSAAAEPSSDD